MEYGSELPPVEAAIAANWLGVRKAIQMHYTSGDPAPAQLRAEVAKIIIRWLKSINFANYGIVRSQLIGIFQITSIQSDVSDGCDDVSNIL